MRIFKNNKLWNILKNKLYQKSTIDLLDEYDQHYALDTETQLIIMDSLCKNGDYNFKELIITEQINPLIYQYLQESIIEKNLSIETKIIANPIKGYKFIFEFVDPETGDKIK